MFTRLELAVAATSVLIMLFLFMGSASALQRYLPVREGFTPLYLFDSGERWLPCALDFDNDWDVSNNYANYEAMLARGVRPKTTIYYREIWRDNYVIYHFMDYEVYNGFVNVHEHDTEGGVMVFVRDNKPFLMLIAAHGAWRTVRVSEPWEIWVYVAYGSHAKGYYSCWDFRKDGAPTGDYCDGEWRVEPGRLRLVPVEALMEEVARHENEVLDRMYRDALRVSPEAVGERCWLWWHQWWWNLPPENLVAAEYRPLLTVAPSLPPLSVWQRAVSAPYFLRLAPLVVAGAFGLALLWRRAVVWLPFFGMLATVGLFVGSYLSYPPQERAFAPHAVVVRNVPFMLLSCVSALAGWFVRWGGRLLGGAVLPLSLCYLYVAISPSFPVALGLTALLLLLIWRLV